MSPGQYLLSPNRQFKLIMQPGDGNLVEYKYDNSTGITGPALWDPPPGGLTAASPRPAGHPNSHAVLQGSDGNFVIESASGSPLWASYTNHPGDVLELGDDGNIVIYASSAVGAPALWATNSQNTYPRGKPATGDLYQYGQCTYWAELEAATYMSEFPQFGGDAKYWKTSAPANGWSVGKIPHIGSVIVFQPGTDGALSTGHVGWVTSVGPSTHTVVFTQMNAPKEGSPQNYATITDGFLNPNIDYIYMNP